MGDNAIMANQTVAKAVSGTITNAASALCADIAKLIQTNASVQVEPGSKETKGIRTVVTEAGKAIGAANTKLKQAAYGLHSIKTTASMLSAKDGSDVIRAELKAALVASYDKQFQVLSALDMDNERAMLSAFKSLSTEQVAVAVNAKTAANPAEKSGKSITVDLGTVTGKRTVVQYWRNRVAVRANSDIGKIQAHLFELDPVVTVPVSQEVKDGKVVSAPAKAKQASGRKAKVEGTLIERTNVALENILTAWKSADAKEFGKANAVAFVKQINAAKALLG
jgi:hypothetical protein